jgi:hypothetical protein
MRWRGTTGQDGAWRPAGRTQDTGDRADGTAVRGRAKAQGIEVKHRRRVPAEPLVEFKATTGQQNPGHPSLPGYAVSRSSSRNEYVGRAHTYASPSIFVHGLLALSAIAAQPFTAL